MNRKPAWLIFMGALWLSFALCALPSGAASPDYDHWESVFEKTLEGAGDDTDAIRRVTSQYAWQLYDFARGDPSSAGKKAMAESAIYFGLAGEAQMAEAAFQTAHTGAVAWDTYLLLAQAATAIPGKMGKAREMAIELANGVKRDPRRRNKILPLLDELQMTREAAMLRSEAAAAAAAARAARSSAPQRIASPPRSGPRPKAFSARAHRSGKTISLERYRGRIVLIDFWATWCGPCIAELPSVQKTYEQFHHKGFEIIGVSLDRDLDRLTAFLRANKMPWPQIADGKSWNGKIPRLYGIRSIPSTLLIGRDGTIVARGLRGERLYEAVAQLVR